MSCVNPADGTDSTVTGMTSVLAQFAVLTINETLNVPFATYIFVGFCTVLVFPFPKSHAHVIIVSVGDEVDKSVNVARVF